MRVTIKVIIGMTYRGVVVEETRSGIKVKVDDLNGKYYFPYANIVWVNYHESE